MAMQVPTEEEILAGAIAGTEDEVGKSAFLSDEDFQKDIDGELPDDDNGTDRSLEEMDDDIPGESEEGDDEPDEEEPDGETDETEEEIDAAASEDGEEPEPTQSEDRGRIPSSRLREETERRRAIEQERDNLRAELAAFRVQQQQRPQPQQEQPAEPDIWSDPAAWKANLRKELKQEIIADQFQERMPMVEESLQQAHREHGEAFNAAYRSLTSMPPDNPQAQLTVRSIAMAPDPGRALMNWHDRQEAYRDPQAYVERKLQERLNDPEVQRQVLAKARGEAMTGDSGRPRTTTRLPKSLNGASGGGSVRNADPELYNDSDASAFAFAMK